MNITKWLLQVQPSEPGELQLIEELGPKGRRNGLVATAVLSAGLLGALSWVVIRFRNKGQFAPELWSGFKLWATWKFLLVGLVNTLKAAGLATVIALLIALIMAVFRSQRTQSRFRDVFIGASLFFGVVAAVAAWPSHAGLAFAVIAGVVVAAALSRMAGVRPSRAFAAIYIEAFRACALVLLITFGFIFFPRVFPHWKLQRHAYVSLVTGLTLYYSTVLAEVIRSGIRSIPNGQSEAALAIGLSDSRVMRLVVLPQALRRALPNLIAQVASLLKDTSLGIFVTYEELTKRAQINGEFAGNNLQTFIVAGAIYVSVIAILSRVANSLKRRQRV